uniref:Uncharacterized protein n=1 Tax=Fagus sylvatica TaxID=28930 RepID=A0A2N9HYI9_FAGSY
MGRSLAYTLNIFSSSKSLEKFLSYTVDTPATLIQAIGSGSRRLDQDPGDWIRIQAIGSFSSCVNEVNFQLMFGHLDSLATSMGNLTTSMDNFSTMITQRFLTYDENFARLAQTIEDINERLRQHGI